MSGHIYAPLLRSLKSQRSSVAVRILATRRSRAVYAVVPSRHNTPITRLVLIGVFFVVSSVCATSLLAPGRVAASTGIEQAMSFEGKIVTSAGQNIPDGTYNMEFRVYTGCTNEPTSNAGCTPVWTEDWLNNNSQGVTFSSGTYQLNLGSICGFGTGTCENNSNTAINWNSYPLYLSLQIGNTSNCSINNPGSSAFTADCGGDGVMNPYVLLTSTPYSFNSSELGGLTASQFGQIAANNTWTGSNIIQDTATSAFEVQPSGGGTPVLNIDTTNGQADIGTTTGQASLTVQGTTTTSAANSLAINDSSGNSLLQVRNDGQVLLGKTAANTAQQTGHTTIGSHADNGFLHLVIATKITTGSLVSNLTSISAYVQATDVSPNNKYILGIYADNNGTPGSLLASSAQGTLTAAAWNTLPISAGLSANTSYWLAFSTNTTSNTVNFVPYDTGSTTTHAYMSSYANAGSTMPSSFTANGTSAVLDSIYATANAVGPLGTAVTISPTNGVNVTTPTNTSSAFQVQNAADSSLFNVSTTTTLVNDGMVTTAPTGIFNGAASWSSGNYVELNSGGPGNDGEIAYNLNSVGTNWDAKFSFESLQTGTTPFGDGTFFFASDTSIPASFHLGSTYGGGGYEFGYDELTGHTEIDWQGTAIASSTGTYTFNNSTWHTAEIVKSGTTFTIYFDGTSTLTYTDTSRTLTGTYFGIGGCSCSDNGEHRAKAFTFTTDQVGVQVPLVQTNAIDATTTLGTLSIGGNNATTVNVGTNVASTIVNIGNGAVNTSTDTVYVGSTNGSSSTTLQGGKTTDTISSSGDIVQTSTNSTTGFQVQNASANGSTAVLSVSTSQDRLTVNGGNITINGVANPSAPSLSTTTGGSLASGTYYYKLAAISMDGSVTMGIASSPSSVSTATSGTNNLSWTNVTNNNGYLLYQSTNGTTWLVRSLPANTTSYSDTSSTGWLSCGSSNPSCPQNTDWGGGLYLQSSTPIIFDNGTGSLEEAEEWYEAPANTLLLGNYNSNGIVHVEASNFGFRDTTTYHTDFSVNNTGQAVFSNSSNSTTAFQIQNSTNTSTYFTVNTSGAQVIIGTGSTGQSSPTLLIVDSGTSSSDPTEVDGAIYYNSSTGLFRCGQGGAWMNCVSSVQTHNLNQGATAGSTTSTTFVTMPGTPTLTFTKAASSTNLLVTIQTSVELSVQSTFSLGFSIGATNYTCMTGAINTAIINDHISFSCSKLVSGIAAGSTTVKMIWETGNSSATLSQSAGTSGDWESFTAQETN